MPDGYGEIAGMIGRFGRWLGLAVLAVLVVGALVLAGAWFFVVHDPDALRTQLEDALEQALERDVAIGADLDIRPGLRPTVQVRDITVANADWGSPRPMLQIGLLEVTFRLTPIVTRRVLVVRRLAVSDVDAWVENDAKGRSNWALTGRSGSGPAPLELQEILADNLSITYRDWDSGEESRYSVERLAARPAEKDSLHVEASGSARGLPAKIRLSLQGRTNLLRGQGFPLAFDASLGDASLSGYGTLAELDLSNAAGTDLHIQLEGNNLRTLQPLTPLELPETNRYTLALDLDSDATELALDQISGKVELAGGAVSVKGRVGRLLEFAHMDLNVQAQGTSVSQMTGIKHWLAETTEFSLEGHATGSWEAPGLDNVKGHFVRPNGTIDVSGSVADVRKGSGIDAGIRTRSQKETLLSRLLEISDAPVNEANGEMRIVGDWPDPAIEGISVEWIRGERTSRLSGRIAGIKGGTGVDLDVDAYWDDLRLLEPLTGLDLYETDSVRVKGRLTGSGRNLDLAIDDGKASEGPSTLAVRGYIRGIPDRPRTDLSVDLEGSDLEGFGKIYDLVLPATQAYRLRGRLSGIGGNMNLDDARVSASREGLIVEANGRIEDFFGDVVLNMDATATGNSVAALGDVLGLELPATDTYRLEGQVVGPAAKARVDAFQGSLARGSAQVTAGGTISWSGDEPTFNVTGRLAAATLADAGAVADLSLPAIPEFNTNFSASGTPRAFDLRLADFALDDSRTNADLQIRVPESGPVSVRGSLNDGTLRLDTRDYAEDSSNSPKDRWVPDIAFDSLTPEGLDLELSAKGVGILLKQGRFAIRDARLATADGLFSLKPAVVDYAGGTLDLSFVLDRKQSPTAASLRIEAKDLVFGQVITELAGARASGGTLTGDLDLSGTGNGLRQALATSSGRLAILAEDGSVAVAGLQLLATDLILDALPLTKKRSEVKLNCVMQEWIITDGIARAGLLYVDGHDLRIRGTGNVNLVTEGLDVKLAPRPKKARILAHNVDLDIRGTISAPKIRANAASSALKGAVTYGKYVLLGPAGLLIPTDRLAQDYPRCAESLKDLPAPADKGAE
jgi:uncharacterized protein involved in outer membrane biogenesis